MKYISTRGEAPSLSFEDVVLTGLASDGGLYVPEKLPHFSKEEISSWVGLDYQSLAFKVIAPFVNGEIPDEDLRQLIASSYETFRHDAIAPLVQTGHNEWVLELFHGPTLAFKDFALQFLGNLLDYVLKKRGQKVVIMGATSGDTGSAAIEGCRHSDNVDIFILHPHNRVSEVQRRQMTTVLEDNIHNIALEGNFDDCQNMVKASFADQSFLPEGRQLAAVNSINWARIMAQIVYYFYASLALGGPDKKISFSVPTGNFGDIFAGYLAKQMGLPIDQLVIGTNGNDILHRCLSDNDHSKKALIHSLSPSMDIMVSSNFERLLFDFYERDGAEIAEMMRAFSNGESIALSAEVLDRARQTFGSYCMDDDETIAVIRDVYERSQYLLDPHTAIGLQAGRKVRTSQDTPMVCLATAHPAKFPEAAKKAGQ
ncbi:MAG: threonine synthase, partial [Alteromonadaceae bacterium]